MLPAGENMQTSLDGTFRNIYPTLCTVHRSAYLAGICHVSTMMYLAYLAYLGVTEDRAQLFGEDAVAVRALPHTHNVE